MRRTLESRFGLVLTACLVLLIALAVLRTQPAAASDDSLVTTLYPGWNLIGWIHSDEPVDTVFDQIPELSAVALGSERAASRDADTRTLQTLRFGEGYWFLIEADAAVEWRRDATPLRRSVALQAGTTMVAWLGGQRTPISEAVDSLGSALTAAWSWDAPSQSYAPWATSLDAPAAHLSQLQRGHALWLEMSEPTIWDQPQLDFPTFYFPGQVSDAAMRATITSVRWVIEQFDTRYSAIADLTNVTVIVPGTPADFYGEGIAGWGEPQARLNLPTEDNPQATILYPAPLWDASSGTGGLSPRRFLARAYYRVLQTQLAGSLDSRVPSWFTNGGDLLADLIHPDSPDPLFIPSQWQAAQYDLADTPVPIWQSASLDQAEQATSPELPEFEIGSSAIAWLIVRHGVAAHFELLRSLGSDPGGDGAWERAFEAAYGTTPQAFYMEYNEWLRLADPIVEGRVIAEDWIRLDTVELSIRLLATDQLLSLPVAADGSFRGAAPPQVGLLMRISLPNVFCNAYLNTAGGLSETYFIEPFTLPADGLSGVELTLPDDFCSTFIGGLVLEDNGRAMDGIDILACKADDSCFVVTTRSNGGFYFLTTGAAEFRLKLRSRSGDCTVYYRGGGITDDADLASTVTVGPESGASLMITVPPGLCPP